MTKRTLVAILVISCFAQSAIFGTNKKFSFSLKGGYYSPSSSTFNNESIPPTNQEIRKTASMFQSLGYSVDYKKMEKLGGALTYGLEIEFNIWRKFSIALGGEFWITNQTASVNASGNAEGNPYNLTISLDWEGVLIPILSTVRMSFPMKRWKWYVGVGFGYYMGEVYINSYMSEKELTSYERNFEAIGHSLLPHFNGGFIYSIYKNISIAFDLRFPIGKIRSFEIKKSLDSSLEGLELTFVDENGQAKTFQWELSGFNFGVFLRLSF